MVSALSYEATADTMYRVPTIAVRRARPRVKLGAPDMNPIHPEIEMEN